MCGSATISSLQYSSNQMAASSSTPLSATALLQKAALMGSTIKTNSSSIFFGNTSTTTSTTISTTFGVSNYSSSSHTPSLSDLHHQPIPKPQENLAAPGDALMVPIKLDMTRDFIGMGGEDGINTFLPQWAYPWV
ncbi:hypothetical protein NMG60_11005494 [Bertholletia excelsa]